MVLSAGLDFLRFELAGHGSDIANYAKADFNVWKRQTLEVIDTLVEGDVLMVGSSIGGWLSLIAARERPERVKGLIGLAAAPECQKDLYAYAFNEEQIAKLESGESLEFGTKDFSYVFTKKLIDSCRQTRCWTSLWKSIAPFSCARTGRCLRSLEAGFGNRRQADL